MDSTLTIRLSKGQRGELQRRARAEGKSESALLREILTRETERSFNFERVKHLAGSLSGPVRPEKKDSWREAIRQRNWRG